MPGPCWFLCLIAFLFLQLSYLLSISASFLPLAYFLRSQSFFPSSSARDRHTQVSQACRFPNVVFPSLSQKKKKKRVISQKFFLLISQRIFHLYMSISCVIVSSWSFPAALSVLVFHVPMVMLSFPRIFDDAPEAYLTPPSWCTAEGAVLVDLGGNRSGMKWLLVFIIWWITGKVQPDTARPSPGQTRGRWVHRGTLAPIGPLSLNYEDIRPEMPCWHQLFHHWCRLPHARNSVACWNVVRHTQFTRWQA